jgi:membrane-associated protein
VIIGGVAAGSGNQSLALVIAAGALGAFLGDNTAYLIGRRLSAGIGRWATRKPKRQARLDWANKQIRQRGGLLLITARFIPGGRTALTVSSGITHQSHPWFAAWVGAAAVIWASYAALLGFVGGKAFKDDHTKAFLLAFAAAITMTVLIEIVRHTRARRASRRDAAAAAALLER